MSNSFDGDWRNLAFILANKHGFTPALVKAIVQVESAGNPWASKPEPLYRWTFETEKWAKRVGVPLDTETWQQKASWGLMQIMGAVARERGCTLQYLDQLCDPKYGLKYGIEHLKWLRDAKGYQGDNLISAYNQGSPRREPDGLYVNQKYVNRVQAEIARLEA